MSGHSHFATIKRKKEATDKKRGQVFARISQVIALAAKQGGKVLENNPKLKNAIEEAKKINAPKSLIDKAIQKGAGELAGSKIESFLFEAMGPENSIFLIEGITDNKNRTLGEIKKILQDNKGKLVTEGSVKWQFEQKGIIFIKIKNKEEQELEAIEVGAENIEEADGFLKIYTKMNELEDVKKHFDKEIESSKIEWVAKEKIEVNNLKEIESLAEALFDNDDIQEVYSNLK